MASASSELGSDLASSSVMPSRGGYHPRDSVHVAVGHGERASDVAYGGAGAHRAERDDMGHVFAPVLFDHVVDDFLAAVVLEVHVNVRHLLAFQVQESLEDEPVGERVHVGHAQAVEREAGGGASAHREEYVALPHEAGYVPDHEEVVVESGLAYDFKLIAQPFLLALARVRQAAFQPFPADVGQVLERGEAVRDVVAGQAQLGEVNIQVAHIGDQLRISHRLRQVAVHILHLSRAGEVVGVLDHAEALFVLHVGVGVDADEDVLEMRFVLVYVVRVIGGDDGEGQVAAQFQQALVYLGQFGNVAVPHQLQVVVAEHLPIPTRGFARLVHASLRYEGRDFAARAAGQHD